MDHRFENRVGIILTQLILLTLAGILFFAFIANVVFSLGPWLLLGGGAVVGAMLLAITSRVGQTSNQKWYDRFMRWELQIALGIILVGTCLRILWSQFSGVEQSSDFAFFANMAEQVYRGDYLLTPRKQSGPALVGAFIYWLLGAPNINAVLLVQAAISSLTLPLVYFGTKRVFGPIAALMSLLVVAFNPESWVYTNLYGNEPYIAFFITAAWLLISKELGEEKTNWPIFHYLLAGLALGLAQYMRATGTLVFAAFFIYVLLVAKPNFRCLVGFAAGFVLMISPIINFNYQKLGIISTSPSQYSGMSLLIGANVATKGRYYGEFFDEIDQEIASREKAGVLSFREKVSDYATSTGLTLSEAEWVLKDRVAREMAFERLKKQSWQIAKIAILYKIPIFWGDVSGYSWSIETSVVPKLWPNAEPILFSVSRFLHRLCILFGTISLAFVAAFGDRGARQSIAIYGAAALALGGLHMFVEIQSKYHYSIITIFPIIAFGWVRYLGEFREYILGVPFTARMRTLLRQSRKQE